jgi:2-C-methyl-D-erythritol 2,4-cyclodiphosphate synthase
MYRIGFGYDVHQLSTGRNFWLGGIEIPYEKGAVGHSDGDALIHAICDALLGAANLRDIGYHFPDTSNEFKNIDSKLLLKRVISLLNENNYSIVNIDSTICLEKPKIKNYISNMSQVLAETMAIAANCVSIKATTNEKLGFVGREEGIAAYAVVMIKKQENFQ